RPYHHVPVIGHDAVPEDPQRHTEERLVQDALECGVVLFLQEKLGARIGAIQHVIDVTTLDRTGASGHELTLRPGALAVNKKTPVPFSVLRAESSRRRSSTGQSHSPSSRPAAVEPATLPAWAAFRSSVRPCSLTCSTRCLIEVCALDSGTLAMPAATGFKSMKADATHAAAN